MLPAHYCVYQRLQLLDLSNGARGHGQEKAESLHFVIWPLISKEQHASLITCEASVNNAICRFNAGYHGVR